MAIELKKQVARKTCRPYGHRGKKLMVSLEPGDIIRLRELGRRDDSAVEI